MFGIFAVVLFAISFILYAAHADTSIPWTWQGFAILGLLFLALHSVFSWHPWRQTP